MLVFADCKGYRASGATAPWLCVILKRGNVGSLLGLPYNSRFSGDEQGRQEAPKHDQ
jgi:hypothetical protein